ncbi:MAG: triosephosphate isomerase [Candidatus Parcubacteria bacterium]|nr:MAG: triosephosphate isomerase [Candidatus Parcubacteria bacterium]
MEKILIANWKMNPESLSIALDLIKKYRIEKKIDIWVAPPFVYLIPLINKFKKFTFGAQNIYFQNEGPYTGEISPKMIKNIGCKFVIVNHSERRKMGEGLKIANQKIISALNNKIKVIVCLGEEKKISHIKNLKKEWQKQIKILFSGINFNDKNIILAYEPTWAISTYNKGSVSKEIVKEFIDFAKKFGFRDNKIIYGGSVFKENIENYLDLSLDGFLIGSQSLKPENFNKICQIISSKINLKDI